MFYEAASRIYCELYGPFRLVIALFQITDKTVDLMVKGWQHLDTICLSHCLFITDDAVIDIAQNVTQLKYLNIDGIIGITDL